MTTFVNAPPVLLPVDPIDVVPSPETLRCVIREYVHRVEVLRHLLRVALRRERLALFPQGPKTRKAVRT